MGFIYSFLTVFLLSLNLASDIPYTELEQAFSNGNAQAISSMGKEKMLISILDKEGAYSQSQATQVLKDFFTKKPVSSFKFTFKGKETSDGSFAIGEYVSKQDNFRVTVQFKKLNQQFKIERLTIEAD